MVIVIVGVLVPVAEYVRVAVFVPEGDADEVVVSVILGVPVSTGVSV